MNLREAPNLQEPSPPPHQFERTRQWSTSQRTGVQAEENDGGMELNLS